MRVVPDLRFRLMPHYGEDVDRSQTVQIRFIALLKPPFKSSQHYRHTGGAKREPVCMQADRKRRE